MESRTSTKIQVSQVPFHFNTNGGQRRIVIVNKVWRWKQEKYKPAYFGLVLIQMDMEISVLTEGKREEGYFSEKMRRWKDDKEEKHLGDLGIFGKSGILRTNLFCPAVIET